MNKEEFMVKWLLLMQRALNVFKKLSISCQEEGTPEPPALAKAIENAKVS